MRSLRGNFGSKASRGTSQPRSPSLYISFGVADTGITLSVAQRATNTLMMKWQKAENRR